MKRNRLGRLATTLGALCAAASLALAWAPMASAQFFAFPSSSQPSLLPGIYSPTPTFVEFFETEEDNSADYKEKANNVGSFEEEVGAPQWNGVAFEQGVFDPDLGIFMPTGEFAESLSNPDNTWFDPSTTRVFGPGTAQNPSFKPANGAGLDPSPIYKDQDGNPIPPCYAACNPSADCAAECYEDVDLGEMEASRDWVRAELEAWAGRPAPNLERKAIQVTTCGGYGVCHQTQPPAQEQVVQSSSGDTWTCGAGAPMSKWKHSLRKAEAVGDNTFGAGYHFEVGMSGESPQHAGTVGAMLEAKGSAAAWVRVFGAKVDALGVYANAKAEHAKAASASFRLVALGIDIYKKSVKGMLTANKVVKVPFFKASTTFMAVFIPVNVGVSVDGGLGLQAQIGPHPDGLFGTLKPNAFITGSAWGGIGVPGFKIGLDVALDFLKLALPVDVALSVASQCLRATAKLTLELQTLSGKLNLLVEFLWIKEKIKIFDWPGFKHVIPLFDFTATARL